ncbi:D-isomer specific 2-hydroxyacid dehydrogenase [Mycena rosella]|uniref:D-isomer specific 2-hydroxyacid dehydrogenase n=1 Tax=Mycena rosella TaxID=1033263 RepID=A0AAD7DQY3_MYCRO|nr:D-isomer specific 2-hydroxyacid dehydrogenase [Mycena rosella]
MSSGDVRPKVVICRDLGPAMPLLMDRTDIEVVLWPENRGCERAWLLENIKGAAGVLVLLPDTVNAELLEAAGPSLRVVSTMSVGYEHIDMPLMAQRKIRVGYTPDVLTEAVADLSVMLALMAGRNDGAAYTLVKDGDWPKFNWSPFTFCGPQLSTTASSPTRTVGFLGFGRIAQATLTRLVPFGITHCIYSGSPRAAPDTARDAALRAKHTLAALERVDIDRLARESDVLFVLTPGGDETYHLVDAAFLRKMKPLSVLVNTSRGTVVDSDALATALREKWIWGAGLDVVEGEPKIGKDHPLAKEPRCVIVPHIGSATFQTRMDMATRAIDNLVGGVFGTEMPAELGGGRKL